MEERFTEGQRVKITGAFGADKGTSTVSKVLKTRVVLENGQRYDLNGYALSRNRRGPCQSISPERESEVWPK